MIALQTVPRSILVNCCTLALFKYPMTIFVATMGLL